MPLTREGTNVREYKIPAIYEAETTQQVKDIPRPVENAHAFLGTTTDGRLYKFDASSSAADDNFGTLQPSDTSWTGRWKLLPYGTAVGTGDFFNVKSFGATGDGTTDDSAAINAAIDAATNVGGGTVYFPYGTYRLLSTITSLNDRGVRLLGVYGDGLMTTGVGAVLVNDTGGAAMNVNNAVVRGQSTVIERLAIIDGTTGGTYSIQLTGTYQVLVTNCAFETPLLLTSTRDTTIDRCYFTGTAGSYVQLSSAAIDTIIRDCNFEGSGGSSSCIASADSEITGLRLVNNQAASLSGTFLGLTQSSNKVTNLHIEGNHITSVTGETVPASKALIDLAGSFADAFDGVSIENNYFNWDAATYTWGIKGAYVNNSTLSNNRFDTAAITADISLDANSSNNYVVANGLTGSYSDAGTGNQFIDSSNALIGNKTQNYINERTLSKAPSNGLDFTPSTATVEIPDNALLSFGDGTTDTPFSISAIVEIDDFASQTFTIMSKMSGTYEWWFLVDSNGYPTFSLWDNSVTNNLARENQVALETGRRYHLTATYDGSGLVGGLKLYINAVEGSNYADISVGSYVAMHNTAAQVEIGEGNNVHSDGRIYSCVLWNRELSASEIATLEANGNQVPVPDQWAGATATSGTLTVGKRYRITDFQIGDDFTNVGAGSNATDVEFIATGTTPTTWTNSSELTNIGAVASYQNRNLESDTWVDESSNGLNGTITDATRLFDPTPRLSSGTYTPGLTFGGGNTGLTTSKDEGYYQYISRTLIYVEIRIQLTAKGSSTGTAAIGLPVPAVNDAHKRAVLSVIISNGTGVNDGIAGRAGGGASVFQLFDMQTGVGATISDANFTDTTNLYISGTYRID